MGHFHTPRKLAAIYTHVGSEVLLRDLKVFSHPIPGFCIKKPMSLPAVSQIEDEATSIVPLHKPIQPVRPSSKYAGLDADHPNVVEAMPPCVASAANFRVNHIMSRLFDSLDDDQKMLGWNCGVAHDVRVHFPNGGSGELARGSVAGLVGSPGTVECTSLFVPVWDLWAASTKESGSLRLA